MVSYDTICLLTFLFGAGTIALVWVATLLNSSSITNGLLGGIPNYIATQFKKPLFNTPGGTGNIEPMDVIGLSSAALLLLFARKTKTPLLWYGLGGSLLVFELIRITVGVGF